jgi:hypothetical protein
MVTKLWDDEADSSPRTGGQVSIIITSLKRRNLTKGNNKVSPPVEKNVFTGNMSMVMTIS